MFAGHLVATFEFRMHAQVSHVGLFKKKSDCPFCQWNQTLFFLVTGRGRGWVAELEMYNKVQGRDTG